MDIESYLLVADMEIRKVDLHQIYLWKSCEKIATRFGAEVSRKMVKNITETARGLGIFEEKGISVSSIYDIECDFL